MRKQTLVIAISTVVLLLCAGTSLPRAVETRDTDAQDPSFSDLTLEIAAPKEEFNELEPIPLNLALSNKTDQKITGHMALSFTDNQIQLFVSLVGGERRRIKDLSMLRNFTGASSGEIKPGHTYQVRQLIDIDLDKIFPYPGHYQLQAELTNVGGSETVKSNFLMVRIVEPAGIDREAFDFINSKASPSYFLNGYERIVDKKPLSTLEEFVSKFSQSTYGDYAAFQLGEVYFSQKDYEKAIKHLEKLSKKSDFIFANRSKDYLDKAKEKLKHQNP